MILFTENQQTSVSVYDGASEAVLLAVGDLKRDLCRVSGQCEKSVPTSCGIIRIEQSSVAPESYRITVTEESLTVSGGDDLGIIYGIYRISTEFLGVDPFYRFSEIQPEIRKALSVPPQIIESPAPKVRFRGWFINDEDLLCDFRIGGQRKTNYKFYHNVMDVSVFEWILESALRLGLNLIIPGTLIDICNPPERKLVEAAARRGLYVTMHHIEPIGVSHFTAENYFRAQGFEGDLSIVTNPGEVEGLWRKYVAEWAVYGRQVIWQLGLRGHGDMPVWASDPSIPDTDEAHGQIIGNAIALQHRIIAETLGTTDFVSTATLWEEGAELYDAGFLTLPANTGVIFADIGSNQMLCEGLFSPAKSYPRGIYYHVNYYAWGPHFTESCSDEKQIYNYGLAAENSALWYSVLNVANVRETHMGSRLNAAILQDPEAFSFEQYEKETFGRLYGDLAPAMSALRKEYFAAVADLGKLDAVDYNTGKHSHYLRDFGELPFVENVVSDGLATVLGKRWLRGGKFLDPALPDRLRESRRKFEALYEKLCALEPEVPDRLKNHFAFFPKMQTNHMIQIYTWALCCYEGDREGAAEALRNIVKTREAASRNEWTGWYNGDKKMNLPHLIAVLEGRESL